MEMTIPTPMPTNEEQALRMENFKERLKKREIWINEDITDSLVEKLYANLIDLETQSSSSPITVVINSNGGYFYESLVGSDIMGTIACPVKTIALAKACSGGFVLFMSGQERIVHDYTCLMMHAASTAAYDKIPDIKERLDYIQSAQRKMAEFFAYQTEYRTSPQYWMNLFQSGKDKWFSVEEAIALGIAHKIVRRPEMIDPESAIRKPHTWDIMDFARSQL